jgi:hypothetical protein
MRWSYSMNTPASSKSHESLGVYWKCHFHLAGGHVDGDDGVRVEVVARPELRVVDREGVARADDVEVLLRIVGPVCQMPPPPVFQAL